MSASVSHALVLLAGLLLGQATPMIKPAPHPLIEAQLQTYNRHGAEAFATTYAPDAEIVEFATGSLIAKGKAAIRTFCAARFQANARFHAEVIHRMPQSPFVVDQERIAGALSIPGGPEYPPPTAVVVYELKDGSIARAWIVR
jgi:hypothetical protein